MEPHSKRLRIDLTPSEISQEIPQSLLPIACGPLSAKAYRDNHARPLVWLLFGGTGALGKQISRTAIARRDRVFIAALDEADTDCDFPLDKQGPILSNPEKNSSSKSSQSKDSGIENDENIGIDVAGSGKGESNNKEVSSQQTPVQQNNKLGDFPMLNSSNASVTFDPTTKSKQSRGKKRVKIIDPESTASALDIGYLHIDEKFKHLCYRVKCDVRIKESVDRAVQKCLQVFGRIDVVVNCFGYGLMGACEEQLDTEIRSQFETNLMGLFHTTRAVLPYLTNAARMSANDKVPNESIKKSAYRNNVNSNAPITSTPGHIISFTSSMALLGTPGFGPYSATRWAAEGLLESLSFEVEHLGCKVTIIETGYAKSGNKDDDRARVAKTYVYVLFIPVNYLSGC